MIEWKITLINLAYFKIHQSKLLIINLLDYYCAVYKFKIDDCSFNNHKIKLYN